MRVRDGFDSRVLDRDYVRTKIADFMYYKISLFRRRRERSRQKPMHFSSAFYFALVSSALIHSLQALVALNPLFFFFYQ